MSVQRTTAVRAAASRRSAEAEARVRKALKTLAKSGTQVSFVAVAATASVSRQFLYSHASSEPRSSATAPKPCLVSQPAAAPTATPLASGCAPHSRTTSASATRTGCSKKSLRLPTGSSENSGTAARAPPRSPNRIRPRDAARRAFHRRGRQQAQRSPRALLQRRGLTLRDGPPGRAGSARLDVPARLSSRSTPMTCQRRRSPANPVAHAPSAQHRRSFRTREPRCPLNSRKGRGLAGCCQDPT
jgi:plasmid stability protein